MIVEVYGKKGDALFRHARRKAEVLLERWGMADRVRVVSHDVGTRAGFAEACLHDVVCLPTVIVTDGDKVVAQ